MHDHDDLLSDAERKALAQVTAPPAKPLKVAIVDDDKDSSELLAEILAQHHIDSIALTSADDAFRLVMQNKSIGLLITDLRMEPFDGLELIRKIRESERAELPIIIISGNAEVPDAIEAMHLSVVDFLLKPIDVDKLMERVRRELGVQE